MSDPGLTRAESRIGSHRSVASMGSGSAVGYGLATAVGAGSADYLAKTTTDRVGPLSAVWFLELFGASVLVPLALVVDRFRPIPGTLMAGLIALSSLSVLGLFLLYRAFERGRLSIVAPLTSGYPALTVLLSVVLLGERFVPLQLLGLLATLLGIVILAGRKPSTAGPARPAHAGVGSALAAFLAFGLFYFGLKLVLGPIPPVTGAAVTRLTGLAMVAPAILGRRKPAWPERGLRLRAIGFPVIDSLSLVVFNLGVVVAGSLSILTTVSGLYGAVTLAWATLFLRERPDVAQWGGCALVFVGVVCLALF